MIQHISIFLVFFHELQKLRSPWIDPVVSHNHNTAAKDPSLLQQLKVWHIKLLFMVEQDEIERASPLDFFKQLFHSAELDLDDV